MTTTTATTSSSNQMSQRPTLQRMLGATTGISSRSSDVSMVSGCSSLMLLRPALREKIQSWLISFRRLDPRFQILTFFHQVAAVGADKLIEDANANHDSNNEYEDVDFKSAILRSSLSRQNGTRLLKQFDLISNVFDSSSILTVWRPCTYMAMRKMMEGSGVGKGLEIKGKSAKKGQLSAYVPLMQIHSETDKDLVQPLSPKAKMRIYFENRQARFFAMSQILPLARDEAEWEDEIIPSEMKMLNDFESVGRFGVEISQRLFWEGFVKHRDISRDKDGTATGRPSSAWFQDANFKTLKHACSSKPLPSPMPVVYQLDQDDPMRPQTFVMAYEENGTVTPVVSDFDGFLMGWKREALWFGCNLPREQEELMMWCVDNIETILDDGPTTDSWTARWLEIRKHHANRGFQPPPMPEYGFGDPKSYAIMEQAAQHLINNGAVRHGSECFNYFFPQEIDESFLVISDTFTPIRWKYVNVTELQSILSQKIKEGFVFPLNPKWVLCDPGWKKVYDELMASDALYADMSKDVWFPPHTHIRQRIQDIHERHPDGFQQLTTSGRPSMQQPASGGYQPFRDSVNSGDPLSSKAAFDLAKLELEAFVQSMGFDQNVSSGDITNRGYDDDDDYHYFGFGFE